MAKTNSSIRVGDIIRTPRPNGSFGVWRVTAVCLGATNCENIVFLQVLDLKEGSGIDGKTASDMGVPEALLLSNPSVEWFYNK